MFASLALLLAAQAAHPAFPSPDGVGVHTPFAPPSVEARAENASREEMTVLWQDDGVPRVLTVPPGGSGVFRVPSGVATVAVSHGRAPARPVSAYVQPGELVMLLVEADGHANMASVATW